LVLGLQRASLGAAAASTSVSHTHAGAFVGRILIRCQQIQMPEEEDYAALLESTTAAASAPPSKRAKHSKQHQQQQQPSSARNANLSSANDATSQKPTTPSVYLTGLPSDDQLTEDEVALFCSKCGIVKKDPYTGELEVRLMPGDGAAVVNYFRAESVDLALMILDGTLFRDRYPIAVTRVRPCIYLFVPLSINRSLTHSFIHSLTHCFRLHLSKLPYFERNERSATRRRSSSINPSM